MKKPDAKTSRESSRIQLHQLLRIKNAGHEQPDPSIQAGIPKCERKNIIEECNNAWSKKRKLQKSADTERGGAT